MKKINKKELHEIFEELKNKSQTAYNKLYENYYSLVYGITFSILKNKEDCEDVTQEIFTKIYRLDVDKLPTDNEASWLYTVSKNECFLQLRKRKPNINIDEIYEIPETSNGLEEIVDIEYYNNLINGLKEDEKMIVSLKVLSNFTFKKISQIMKIPIGTVQWKYYNSINSLKVSVESLVGAIMAFVIVLSRGEFWNKKEYLNENQTDVIEKNNEDEKTSTEEDKKTFENNESNPNSEIDESVNINSDFNNNTNISSSDNKNEEVYGDTNISKDIDGNTEQTTESENLENATITESNEVLVEKDKKIDSFQIAFITVGIIFLIFFIIFYKIYQQKLKKKPSK